MVNSAPVWFKECMLQGMYILNNPYHERRQSLWKLTLKVTIFLDRSSAGSSLSFAKYAEG